MQLKGLQMEQKMTATSTNGAVTCWLVSRPLAHSWHLPICSHHSLKHYKSMALETGQQNKGLFSVKGFPHVRHRLVYSPLCQKVYCIHGQPTHCPCQLSDVFLNKPTAISCAPTCLGAFFVAKELSDFRASPGTLPIHHRRPFIAKWLSWVDHHH